MGRIFNIVKSKYGVKELDDESAKIKITELIKEEYAKEGYIIHIDHYTMTKEKVNITCPNGHDYISTIGDFKAGFRCRKCHFESKKGKPAWNKGIKVSGAYVKCVFCNKEKYLPTSSLKTHKTDNFFCDKNCESSYYKDKLGDRKAVCPICKNEFEMPRYSEQIYCSHKCFFEGQQETMQKLSKEKYGSEKRSEVLKKMWAERKEEILTKRNTEEYKQKIGDKTKERFNDPVFQEKHREGCKAGMTDERKQLLRKMTINRNINNSSKITRPNLIIADLLQRLGIPYKMEQSVEDVLITDILLTDRKIAIEIFGDYWHCNPIFYKEGDDLSYTQKENLKKDIIKIERMKKEHPDWKMIYLWECDVYFNLDKCEKIILEELDCNFKEIKMAKYSLKEISKDLAENFVSHYHYLKTTPLTLKICYGLYFENSLIGVSVWRSPNVRHTSDLKKGEYLELSRFCLVNNLPKNSASWFLGKCMKQVKIDYPDLDGLISYSDNGLHTGAIYKATNWLELGTMKGSHYYVTDKNEEIDRRKVFLYAKKFNLSEKQLAEELGLKRVETNTKTKFVFFF